jgi:diguanylate cyclase (GGDEF)-like protein
MQGALIAIAIFALVVCRQLLRDRPASLTDAVIAVTVSYGVLVFLLDILLDRWDRQMKRKERDSDILALREKAQTDALTGLLNREAAIDAITQFLKIEGCLYHHTLMIVDLDNFKSVNDNFGHFQGDMVLKTLAATIRDVFRDADIVGRLGGDEFIILMKYSAASQVVHRKALELKSALETITSGGDVTVTVTCSIGISVYNGDGKPFEALYKEADEALYHAKLGGKNRHCCFDGKADNAWAEEGISRTGPALTESSACIQLQALIDNIDGGIALLEVGDDIRAIFLSHSYVRQMNLSYSGIKQADNRVFDFIHGDDIAQVKEALQRGAASGKPTEAVFRRETGNNRLKWYHLRAVRIQYENSEKPVLLAIVTDVTNLKETALNFQAQKKQLETVLRISNVVTFEVDIKSRTLLVADPTVTKYGIDTHVIENMPESLIDGGAIHPDSIDETRRMYDEIYAGVPEGSAIIKTLKRDGQFTIERFTYFTVFDDNGRPVKAVGIDEGLETRARARLRLELLERQFRYYSDNMIMVVKVCLKSNTYELLKGDAISREIAEKSGTAAEFFEYGLTNVDEKVRDYLRQKYSTEGLLKNFDEGRAVVSDEYFANGPDGKRYFFILSATSYINQVDGDIYAYVRIRDITRRKQLEDELYIELRPDPATMSYCPETLERLAAALMNKADRKLPYAVVRLSMVNYSAMLEQYGSVMMEDILVGFLGKVKMIIYGEHILSNDGKGSITVLVPEVHSDGWLLRLMEETVKLLKNPAFFQIHEEVFAEYRCGIALSDENNVDFNGLSARALAALQTTDGDDYVNFFM